MGVPQAHAYVMCFDERLVTHAATRQPSISREWLREGLCALGASASSADGASINANVIPGMKKLGWPDHRPLVVDLWAQQDLSMLQQ